LLSWVATAGDLTASEDGGGTVLSDWQSLLSVFCRALEIPLWKAGHSQLRQIPVLSLRWFIWVQG